MEGVHLSEGASLAPLPEAPRKVDIQHMLIPHQHPAYHFPSTRWVHFLFHAFICHVVWQVIEFIGDSDMTGMGSVGPLMCMNMEYMMPRMSYFSDPAVSFCRCAIFTSTEFDFAK